MIKMIEKNLKKNLAIFEPTAILILNIYFGGVIKMREIHNFDHIHNGALTAYICDGMTACLNHVRGYGDDPVGIGFVDAEPNIYYVRAFHREGDVVQLVDYRLQKLGTGPRLLERSLIQSY